MEVSSLEIEKFTPFARERIFQGVFDGAKSVFYSLTFVFTPLGRVCEGGLGVSLCKTYFFLKKNLIFSWKKKDSMGFSMVLNSFILFYIGILFSKKVLWIRGWRWWVYVKLEKSYLLSKLLFKTPWNLFSGKNKIFPASNNSPQPPFATPSGKGEYKC